MGQYVYILEYATSSIYEVCRTDTDIWFDSFGTNDEFIRRLGFNTDCCCYMITNQKLEIINLLKQINYRQMELNKYQSQALETRAYPEEFRVIYPALGMNGEAGEVADKVKKIIRDTEITRNEDGSIDLSNEQKEALAMEIGDVLWYVAILSYDLGYSLEDIAIMNYQKLHSRMQRDKIKGSGDNR